MATFDPNVSVNVYWTNSSKFMEHEFLRLTIEEKCSIRTFRKRVLKLIMEIDKIPHEEHEKIEKEDCNLDSMIGMITSLRYFLSNKDDYLTVSDFKDQSPDVEFSVIVKTKKCGSVYFGLRSFNWESPSCQFNLSYGTLAGVKHRIHHFSKIPPNDPIKIFHNGKELDQQCLDCPITNFWKEDTYNIYYYKPIEEFSVFVNVPAGLNFEIKTFPIVIQSEATIYEVKCHIEKSEHIPHDQQVLMFETTQLKNEGTLADYNIGNGSILLVVLKMSDTDGSSLGSTSCGIGVTNPAFSLADLSASLNIIERSFSLNVPEDWRKAGKGLNIEGNCGNNFCKAYNQRVICRMGFQDFHFKNDCGKIKCPICWVKLTELRTFIFMSTFWRHFGRKEINPSPFIIQVIRQIPELLSSNWTKAGDESYIEVDINEFGGWSWSFLVIQTRQNFEDETGQYPQPLHCGICFQRIEGFKLIRFQNNCGHIYHKFCMELHHYCPLCQLKKTTCFKDISFYNSIIRR